MVHLFTHSNKFWRNLLPYILDSRDISENKADQKKLCLCRAYTFNEIALDKNQNYH